MSIMSFLSPPKKAGDVRKQIDEMTAALAKLIAERRELDATIEAHDRTRGQMLLSSATEDDILALDRQCDLAKLRSERLGLAQFELENRIERARDKAERERLAAEHERAASAIEQAAKTLETPVAHLAAAFAALVEAIPAETGATKVFEGHIMPQPARPEDVAQAILGNALYAAAPRLFEATTLVRRGMNEQALASVESVIRLYALDNFKIGGRSGKDPAMLPAPVAADQLIIAPLREKARTLREGVAEHLMAAE
ncbi:hypothetical protein [Methylocystis suflitae]|uniref:hypothetical protein n=1 Tax=Methylocystis suflitae TaxID=2951405 RepID=UPI00210C66DC|nr:hypothetical protein [Methylocystis suflitae]MCQ4188117.1 hypothetical protein [Methylocystis suflitae]